VEQSIDVPWQKMVVLLRRLQAEPGYYAPRLTPERLAAAIQERRAVIRWCDGHIAAITVLWPTNRPDWMELGTVWVGEGLRGRGLRNELMAEAVALAPNGVSLFLFSSVGKIMQSAISLRFEPMTTEKYRVLWWASEVGVVCRLPNSIHPMFIRGEGPFYRRPEKEGERWLFIRP